MANPSLWPLVDRPETPGAYSNAQLLASPLTKGTYYQEHQGELRPTLYGYDGTCDAFESAVLVAASDIAAPTVVYGNAVVDSPTNGTYYNDDSRLPYGQRGTSCSTEAAGNIVLMSMLLIDARAAGGGADTYVY